MGPAEPPKRRHVLARSSRLAVGREEVVEVALIEACMPTHVDHRDTPLEDRAPDPPQKCLGR